MNKRTIILIIICCILAVATLTIRYIEQETDSIRAKFVEQEQMEQRSPRGMDSVRQEPAQTPQKYKAPEPVRQGTGIPPVSNGQRLSSPAAAVTESVPAAGKSISTTTADLPGPLEVRESASAVLPVTTTIEEDVTTPLGSEPDIPAAAYEPEEETGAALQRAPSTSVEELNAPGSKTTSDDDTGSPPAAAGGEQEDRGAEGAGRGENEAIEEDAVTDDNDQGEEVSGEETPDADEEMMEEEQLPAEDFVPEGEESLEQEEEGYDEE